MITCDEADLAVLASMHSEIYLSRIERQHRIRSITATIDQDSHVTERHIRPLST